MFPEWTELGHRDIEAIQHLRLNQLRDAINEVFFPYITLITPYLRVNSWLVWIYDQLEKERNESKKLMSLGEFEDKAERFYKIFASADIIHAKKSGIKHLGPVGIEPLTERINELNEKEVDFSAFGSDLNVNPIDAYATSLEKMRLLRTMLLPVSPTRRESIFISADKGKKLAAAFEKNWVTITKLDRLLSTNVWTQEELGELGATICLHGLCSSNEESTLLLEAASSSIKNGYFKNFVSIVQWAAQRSLELNTSFKAADIGRIALYRSFDNSQLSVQMHVPDSEAAGLLAYHELHTHMSYSADAILAGLSLAAKNNPGGIKLDQIFEKSSEILNQYQEWATDRSVKVVAEDIIGSFQKIVSSEFQLKVSLANGKYGFESLQEQLNQSKKNAFGLIAWGAIALLQSACAEECFCRKWLSSILTTNNDVFCSLTFWQQLQEQNSTATLRDWISQTTKRIIEQHELVANSKGEYAKKIVYKEGVIYCVDEPTEYRKNRGRLDNAIAWLADSGLIQREDSSYKFMEST